MVELFAPLELAALAGAIVVAVPFGCGELEVAGAYRRLPAPVADDWQRRTSRRPVPRGPRKYSDPSLPAWRCRSRAEGFRIGFDQCTRSGTSSKHDT